MVSYVVFVLSLFVPNFFFFRCIILKVNMIVSCRASAVFHISDVDECLTLPCLHDGVCNNLDGSYNCSCQEGWSGDNCQTGNQILLHTWNILFALNNIFVI